MKIALIGCRTVRDGIVVAGFFGIMALALLGVARLLPAQIDYVPAILTALGTILLIMAPLILVASLQRRADRGPPPGAG